MITYNHKDYIKQAIESVLTQKTNFNFRLFIGDDKSTDGASEIIESLNKRFSDKIDFTLNEINLGATINAQKVFNKCFDSGAKYIAMCEGDDYWTDEYKLQKQVDFLEANSGFAICFHNSKIITEYDKCKISYSNPVDQKEISDFIDLVKGEFIYTPTCMFRKNDFDKFPKGKYQYINNYTIDLHNAQYGKIKYLNEVMSVYRIHPGGMWSMVKRDRTLINQLPAYKFYLNYFDKKYKKYFLNHLKNMTNELIQIKIVDKDYKKFWLYYIDYVRYNLNNIGDIKKVLNIFLRVNYHNLKKIFIKN